MAQGSRESAVTEGNRMGELIPVTQNYTKMARTEAECRASNWNVCSEEKHLESPKMAKLWTRIWHLFCTLKGQQSGWVCPTSQEKLLAIPKVDMMNFELHIFGQSSGVPVVGLGQAPPESRPFPHIHIHPPTPADIIATHAHTTLILCFLSSGQ